MAFVKAMSAYFASIILVSMLCGCNSVRMEVNGSRSLYFSLMVSSAAGLNTSGVVPAVDQALQDINSDSAILPGYSLHYTRVADTKVMVIVIRIILRCETLVGCVLHGV